MNITNELISAYISGLYRNDNPKLQELRSFAEESHVPVIMKDTEGLLMSLLKIKKPAKMLEIGAAVGYSACCFADGCGCDVITIESDEESYNAAKLNISELGFEDKVDIRFGDARDVLSELYRGLADEKEIFDAVFIDAAKSHYRSFWDTAMPMCRQDAMIICDNVLMKGMTASDEYDTKRRYKTSIRRMREFISYITHLDYADTCILPVGDGVSISVIDKDAYAGAIAAAPENHGEDMFGEELSGEMEN